MGDDYLSVTVPLVEKRTLTNYQKYIHCSSNVTIFLSSRIALIIDKEAQLDDLLETNETLLKFTLLLQILEQLLNQFDTLTGKRPRITNPYDGRIRIEVSFLPNAAGLAHHGVAGIAIGPAFVKGMIDKLHYDKSSIRQLTSSSPPPPPPPSSRNNNSTNNTNSSSVTMVNGLSTLVTFDKIYNTTMDHVCTYEFMRNYIFPEEFTKVFDYCCLEGDSCWGWVNQGFVNILGCLILPSHIQFTYYGHTKDGFCQSMVQHLDVYLTEKKDLTSATNASATALPSSQLTNRVTSSSIFYSWTDVFLHERLPWNNTVSLDNIYSGLLVILYRNYGANYFIYRFFNKAIPVLLQRCPTSKNDYLTAAENLYLAACIAAQRDLQDYFVRTLRWPLSKEFLQNNLVATLIAVTTD